MKIIHGEKVFGSKVDARTRCAHYHSELDIIAIKFKCCGQWLPCFQCHAEHGGHEPEVWAKTEFDLPVVLCGGCGHQLSAREYFQCDSICPECNSRFNPKCAAHYHLYFENSA